MKYRRIGDRIIISLTSGDEVMSSINRVCEKEAVKCGIIRGIGATNNVEYGILNKDKRTYTKKTVNEDVEITNMTGNITLKDSELNIHIHITLTTIDSAFGGHLFKCVISAVSDIIIDVIDDEIHRIVLDDGTVPMNL